MFDSKSSDVGSIPTAPAKIMNTGINLEKLAVGTRIEAKTKNTFYKILVKENCNFEIEGGAYFKKAGPAKITGSTWGTSALKLKWLAIDMYMEIIHPEYGRITTTKTKSLKVIAPDGSWEYTL